jgi:nucleotide-binding universal stress UspA family protein
METIIWATDGSSGAEEALPAACELADLSGGQIVAVFVSHRFGGLAGGWTGASLEDDVVALIEHQVDDLRERGYFANLVVRRSHQDAAETLALVATELHADVITCGTHGRTPAASALLGSFTQRLLHVAPCPVFAVPPTAVHALVG